MTSPIPFPEDFDNWYLNIITHLQTENVTEMFHKLNDINTVKIANDNTVMIQGALHLTDVQVDTIKTKTVSIL